jgi:hypothetical protein
VRFATVAHKCCCGCGIEVITPLSPTDWKLTFDGESISLHPSIRNWSFDCKSHYWIRRNRIEWAGLMSEKEIRAGRNYDKLVKKNYYSNRKSMTNGHSEATAKESTNSKLESKNNFWSKLKKWLSYE